MGSCSPGGSGDCGGSGGSGGSCGHGRSCGPGRYGESGGQFFRFVAKLPIVCIYVPKTIHVCTIISTRPSSSCNNFTNWALAGSKSHFFHLHFSKRVKVIFFFTFHFSIV